MKLYADNGRVDLGLGQELIRPYHKELFCRRIVIKNGGDSSVSLISRACAEPVGNLGLYHNGNILEGKPGFQQGHQDGGRDVVRQIGAYGDPEYTPGGRAKGFACSVDIRLRRGDWISEGTGDNKEIVGQVVKFKIDKNKTFKRMQTGEFDFYFSDGNNAGIPEFFNDNYKEIIVCAVEWGVIDRTGSWFVYNGQKYQGMNNLVSALKDDATLIEKLKEEVIFLATRKSD